MIKLYLDEDVTPVLARLLRERGYDVVSAIDYGHLEWQDEAHLEYAVQEERALFTYNIRDFARLHQRWRLEGREHYGIIVSSQFSFRELGELLRRMLKLLATKKTEEINNQMLFLGK